MQSSVSLDPQIRARISLYAAGLIASAMGFAALGTVLTGDFTSFAFALLAIGYCTSWGVRARLISSSTLAAVMLIVLVSTLAALIIEPQFRYQLVPAEVLDAPDLLAAIVLASLMVVYSFRLATDASVLFLCVPSLSLIGLLATADPTTEMLAYFAVYVAATSFALIRQNALAGGRGRLPKSSLKLDIGLAAGVTLAALAVGSLVGTLVYPLLTGSVVARMSGLEAPPIADPIAEEFVPIATGPVDLSDQEVMTVKCNQALLWREMTYNKYTGQGWASTLFPQEQAFLHPVEGSTPKSCTFKIVDRLQTKEPAAVKVVEQTFRITSGSFRPVFAAPEPQSVTFDQWKPRLRLSAGLMVYRPCREGAVYHVVSKVSVVTPRQLRTASNVYPEIIRARYLGTPQSCWQVQKLTGRVTETATTPLQKAQAIENYLSANYVYDTNAPAAPQDKDAVTYFLFESKRGYCDIFASAMVVMCRQAGVPARWATGFASGAYDPGDGAYHVRVKDRHAWAEIYFPEYGWIPFDVTPAQQRSNWFASLRNSLSMVSLDYETLFAGGLLFLLIAYLIKTEVIDRIRLNRRRLGWQYASDTTEIGQCYQRMCRILAGYGHPRCQAMTPLEYASRTNGSIAVKQISETVDILTADFVEFRYSNREPTPDKIETMKNNLQALARNLRKARREKLPARQ